MHSITPYIQLMRLNKPIGIWLLMWPCFWSIVMASNTSIDYSLFFFFFIGSVVMRSAGCIYNDIVDKDLDNKVKRTKNRPVASGVISVQKAWIVLLILCLLGFIILLQLNSLSQLLGIISLFFVGFYPFMKRWTWWPQAFLGLTFNWGILMGWAAADNSLSLETVYLYLAGFFWTIGYDTIYAHQDKEDDVLAGVKSTARLFGQNSKIWILIFFILTSFFWGLAGQYQEQSGLYFFGVALATILLGVQVWFVDLEKDKSCLFWFKFNQWIGAIIFLFIFINHYL